MLDSLLICFSMYSIIPMVNVKWTDKNIKHSLCYLPIIGLIIGFVEYGWLVFAHKYSFNGFFYTAVATIIPVIISGGIHVDGFIDTCDAVFSYADREKRLEILKDPQVGALGVIYCLVYFITTMGLFAQLFETNIRPIAIIVIFAISRAVSAFATVTIKSAKLSGLKHTFSKDSDKFIKAVLICWAIVLFVILFFYSFYVAVYSLVLLFLFFLWFKHYFEKHFGGITGDLVGFSMCIGELIMLFVIVIHGMFL